MHRACAGRERRLLTPSRNNKLGQSRQRPGHRPSGPTPPPPRKPRAVCLQPPPGQGRLGPRPSRSLGFPATLRVVVAQAQSRSQQGGRRCFRDQQPPATHPPPSRRLLRQSQTKWQSAHPHVARRPKAKRSVASCLGGIAGPRRGRPVEEQTEQSQAAGAGVAAAAAAAVQAGWRQGGQVGPRAR